MNIYYNKHESNKAVYDDLREFCICERINEEYTRTLIKKPNNFSKKKAWNFKLFIKRSILGVFSNKLNIR